MRYALLAVVAAAAAAPCSPCISSESHFVIKKPERLENSSKAHARKPRSRKYLISLLRLIFVLPFYCKDICQARRYPTRCLAGTPDPLALLSARPPLIVQLSGELF
ncbi:hypothetical protein F4811DRAFT_6867 [Daldinia bambusicola]|nr:hypothetical protein F4811DRAFT_6867 [Daldinia bambusicola]